jgi:sugar phosphate isomerase/epimerase
MHLGIFAKTFPRPTLEETLDAVVALGLTHIQFNMSCLGLATLPDRLDEGSCVWIAQSLRERGLTMAAVSGTFNMSDPSTSRVENNLRRLEVLAAACRWLDTRIITLCTGTVDSHDMWKWHPDNVRKSTWERLVETMREAVKIADRHEVTLAFEPEIHNVVSSVMRARKLLDEVGSPWLKVVLDPANLLHAGDSLLRPLGMLDEAFDWLGEDIVLAHAKNSPIIQNLFAASPGEFAPLVRAASGQVSPDLLNDLLVKMTSEAEASEIEHVFGVGHFYLRYIIFLRHSRFRGALIMHGFDEKEVAPMFTLLDTLLKLVSEPG